MYMYMYMYMCMYMYIYIYICIHIPLDPVRRAVAVRAEALSAAAVAKEIALIHENN